MTNVSYGYQWIANDGTSDTDITDATDSSYTLVAADEGKTIKVRVSFTDDAANGETLTSTATEAVSFAVQQQTSNNPATGSPTISGTVQVGETLTTDTSGIADDDGLTNVSYSYQWARNDGSTDTDITGAADSSYTLVDADEGQTIKVKVTFADDAGDEETLTSAATATVAARPNTPMTSAQDDTTAPTISSVDITSDPDTDIQTHGSYQGSHRPDDPFAKYWYRIGEQVTATVTFTENIAVTGAPQLRLNVGTSQKLAIFQSANGATAAFTYTITEGDSDTNGISFSPNGLTLQGGTIKDNADNDAALSYSAVPTLSTHKVDGIRPRIRGLTVISQWRQGFSPNDDVSDIGNEILIDAQFSEPVFGSTAGPPQVNLQIGNESRQADWDVPTRSYPDYVFSYFVQEGDWDSDGVSMSAGSVNLNGGYIKDAAGNDAILTYSAVTSERRVDGIRPFITSIAITSDPGTDQAYDEGDEIEITVTFNEPVYASYNNHIEIDIGGTPRQAVAPATTLPAPQEVPFTYTVQNGDHDSDGISIGANKLTSTHPFFHIRDAFSDWPGGNLAYMEHMALPAQTTHKVAHTSSENIPTTQNHAPTGQPAITGVAQKKRTLHANVSDIADLNGLYNATFTYQWIRDQNHADMNIPNATGSTYTLTSEDVGNRVKVQVSFTDDQYHYEVVTSAPTATVADAPNSPATGAPAISGTAQVDKTLAAVTSGISDDDGLTQVAYAYRWIRNDGTTDTDILGANTARYTLTNADQDKYIKVRVTFTDDEQNPEQLTSRQTEAVTAPLTLLEALTVSPGTLTPTFDNSTTRYNIPDVSNVDERITIMTRTKAGTTLTFVKANVGIRICQAPPCGPWSYYDFDNNEITPLTDADSHVDGFQIDLAMGDNMLMLQANTIHSIEYESYRFTITRAEEQEPSPNSPATGSPVISGSTNVGQTLTSSVSAISDDDGTTNTTFSYQWLSNRDTEIGGATSSTYTLVSADEGKTLKVRVTFTDDAGNEETLTSTATDAVTSPDQQQTPNTPARGTPTISGTSQVKQTLTANTSSIVDDDGLTNVAYSYQWITNDGNSDTDIAGETGITYTLIETDQGNTIKVQVAFTDDADNDESLTSQATAPVAAAAPTKPPGIPRNLTGTANADGTVTLTWDAPNNHSVTGYQILRRSPTLGEKKLLVYVDDTGTTATEYTDRNVVPDELYAYRIKAINAVGLSRQSQFISVTPTQPAEPAQNSPATGTPTISGILQVGETLTANTTGIADADGLTNVTYRYQWIPDDGSFDADNQAPPGSSYTLFEADEGKIIKLEVSFTDDAGNGESLTSAATAAVAARPNTPATGAPTISGTSQVAETLTANTSDIVDDDGLTNVAYSYQWITNDGSSDTDIAGETGITYTLVDTDEGKIIKLEVSFTDDAGNGESLTSAATAAVAARPNTPATGAPTISGTSQVTQTLTANTSDIVDDDGLTNVAYSYQWITNDGSSDTDIAGETGITYTLVDTDEGKTVKVQVAFTDDADNDESLTSQATARVAAAAPTKPPGNPRNLTGAANSDGTVTLTWDAPNNDSVTGYQILRRSPTLGEKKLLVYVDNTGTTATEYTDSNVVPNELYAYRIKAINAVGLSRQSQFISVTPTQPAEPAQNSPATGTPTISGTLQVGETLTANTSGIADADGLTNVTFSYQWLADDTDIAVATASTYPLVSDDEGKTLKVRVRFADDVGNDESLTSAATAAVAAEDPQSQELPAKPTGLTGTVSYNAVSLSWDDPGDASVTGYQVLRRDRALHQIGEFLVHVDDTGSASPEYVDRDVALGVRYVYGIKARNASGLSERSNRFDADMPAMPADPPAKPTGLTGTVSMVSVSLSWDDPGDGSITGYQVLRRDKALHEIGEFLVHVDDTGSASPEYVEEDVAPGARYVYRIKARNASGLSEQSESFDADTTPDFVAVSPSVSDSDPDAGATFTLSATVRNDGASGWSSTLNYYLSSGSTITRSDTFLHQDTVGWLAASGSSDHSIDLTAPSTDGIYYYGACASEDFYESDMTNNCSTAVLVRVGDQPLARVDVTPDEANLTALSDTATLAAKVFDEQGDETVGATVTWSSSNTEVATVSTAGVVTAVANGSATITATASSGLIVTAAVTVRQRAASVEIDPGTVEFTSVGDTATLTARMLDANGHEMSPTSWSWSSADDTVAIADSHFTSMVPKASVRAIGHGTTTVSLRAGGGGGYLSVTVTVTVTVSGPWVEVSPVKLTFTALGDSATVTVRILDENGDEDTDATYGWFSVSSTGAFAIKTVDGGLEVTAEGPGSGWMEITSEGATSAILLVTVYQEPKFLTVSPSSTSLAVGETATLTATITDANGHSIAVASGNQGGKVVFWETSDSEVATIDGDDDRGEGERGATVTVTAVKAGTPTITASWAREISGTATVTVTDSN